MLNYQRVSNMAVMAVMDLWGDPDLFLLFAGPAELGDSQGTQLSWPHFDTLWFSEPRVSNFHDGGLQNLLILWYIYIYYTILYNIYIIYSTFLIDAHEFSMSYTYLAQVVPSSPMKVSPRVWSTGTLWRVTRVTRKPLGAPGAPETLSVRTDDGVFYGEAMVDGGR